MQQGRIDRRFALALGVIALIMRLPFRSHYLYHWDSVNFALSLEHYDVRLHQPHPPGYFLYSMLGRLVNLLVHDANASLVWISVVSGALGVVALYWLGHQMFDHQVGVSAAILALTNPLTWFYSEIALSYSLEFLLVTLLVGYCYQQLAGFRRDGLMSAVLLGIAGGVRQNDLVFLFPLWLVSLRRLSWRQRTMSIVVLGMVVMAWAWPMAALSGGPVGYWQALQTESGGIVSESSLYSLEQLGLNGVRLGIYVGYGLLAGAIPLFYWGMSFFREARTYLQDRRAWVMLLWIIPAACFYLFIHLRQHGHIFTFLPALILLSALASLKMGQQLGKTNLAQKLPSILVAAIAAFNGLFFLLAPPSLFGSERLPLRTPTFRSISQRERDLGERITYIKSHFVPEHTVVLAGGWDFRHPDFYLREFQQTSLSYSLGEDLAILPDNVHALVLFNDATLPQLAADPRFQSISLPSGAVIRYVIWDDDERVSISQTSFVIGHR